MTIIFNARVAILIQYITTARVRGLSKKSESFCKKLSVKNCVISVSFESRDYSRHGRLLSHSTTCLAAKDKREIYITILRSNNNERDRSTFYSVHGV